MTKFAYYSIFALALFISLCNVSNASTLVDVVKSPITPIKKTSQTKILTIDAKKELIEWDRAIQTEVYRLVDSGQNNLEIIIKLVNENTQELEESAQTAYINQRLEYFKFGNILAQENYQQSVQECNEQLHQIKQGIEQTNRLMENQFLESCKKSFNEKKLSLINKYYAKANEKK